MATRETKAQKEIRFALWELMTASVEATKEGNRPPRLQKAINAGYDAMRHAFTQHTIGKRAKK